MTVLEGWGHWPLLVDTTRVERWDGSSNAVCDPTRMGAEMKNVIFGALGLSALVVASACSSATSGGDTSECNVY